MSEPWPRGCLGASSPPARCLLCEGPWATRLPAERGEGGEASVKPLPTAQCGGSGAGVSLVFLKCVRACVRAFFV